MSEFRAKSICILGRQPALGLAELESLYGDKHIKPIKGAALLDIPAAEINFKNLGGTVKVARLLDHLLYSDFRKIISYLIDKVPQHLQNVPEGKFTLGLSVYGLKVKAAEINRAALEIKRAIKQSGHPVRVVPNKAPALSSAQVLHNKLTHLGAWELILIADGSKTYLAQTIFVQDINAYAARDQVRPKRDPRVGMLPPKLGQIILNLASPVDSRQKIVDRSRMRVLDPFCGTGVILQEALLMGHSVIGTDIEPKMVEFAKTNIQWLFEKYPQLEGHVVIEAADATSHRRPRFSAVASEVYLGRPLSSLPAPHKLKEIVSDVNIITEKFLRNLALQLRSGQRLCLAVPAWRRPAGELVHLPLIAKLTDMGYNRFSFEHVKNDDLVYFRENQIVARELLVLERR